MHKVMIDEKSRISMQYQRKWKVVRTGEHFEIARVVWKALSTSLKEKKNLKNFNRHLKFNLRTLNLVNFEKGNDLTRGDCTCS